MPVASSRRRLRGHRGLQDLDVSGGKLKGRKGFLALIEHIKAGGVDVVAAYDQSRAFRNTPDALDF